MKYAELFAGIGLGSVAMKEVFGARAECVFFSEISRPCIRTFDKHHPGHKNIGDISLYGEEEIKALPDFDFLIGGSPCQDLSIARGKREGLDGDQSGLFYVFADMVRIKKPKFFLLENVASMDEDSRDEISRVLGVEPVMISSISFTGQDRQRLYWANFKIQTVMDLPVDARLVIDKTELPTDPFNWKDMHSVYFDGERKGRTWLRDHKSEWDVLGWSRSTRYKEFDTDQELQDFLKTKELKHFKYVIAKKKKIGISYVEQRVKVNMGANTLVTGKNCARFSSKNFIKNGPKVRQANALECARWQGIPDGYLDHLSLSAKWFCIGNSFTLDVIVHILKSCKEHNK